MPVCERMAQCKVAVNGNSVMEVWGHAGRWGARVRFVDGEKFARAALTCFCVAVFIDALLLFSL